MKTKMTITKKIIAWIVLTLLALPCLLALNGNMDAPHLNLIGIAYAVAIVKLAPKFLPKWIIDYYNSYS